MHASLMLSWIFVQHCKLCCSPDREDLGMHRFSSCLMSQVACEPPQTGIHWWSEVVAWHSPEHVFLIFQSGKTRAECLVFPAVFPPLWIQSRCETQGTGEHCMCIKISEARWMSLGICRGHGKQIYFHYSGTHACQVTLSDCSWCIGLAEPVGGKF